MAESEGCVLAFCKALVLVSSTALQKSSVSRKNGGCPPFLFAPVRIPHNILDKQKTQTETSVWVCWRRVRDSNPRGLAPKRFSRPPRYDHFDTLPNIGPTSSQP